MKKLTVITLILFSINLNSCKNDNSNNNIKNLNITLLKEFTKENFINIINSSKILYKTITIKQSLLETGHFKSNIFKQNKNLFGMKHPKIRKTTSLGVKNNYAYYNNWISSIKDFELWQKDFIERNKIKDSLHYIKRLNEVYSENKNYINILNKIKI